MSTNRILIGYDGREGSADAIGLGATLAEVTGGELVLGIVLETLTPPAGPGDSDEIIGARSAELVAQAAEELKRIGVSDPVDDHVFAGVSPAKGLCEIAASEGCDLIVLGRTHRGSLGRIFPGSTADSLAAEDRFAFAVAPPGYSDRRRDIRLVGLAYDGSMESMRAASVAVALAQQAFAPLRAFSVHEPLPHGGLLPLNDLGPPLERKLDSMLAALPPAIGGQKVTLAGEPAHELLGQGPWGAEIVVFGSHGYGRFFQQLSASVVSKVVREAPWPVLVVPPGAPLRFTGDETPADAAEVVDEER